MNEKEPESQVRIRFPDCDPFNHLNNSRYIDYLINAREDHLMNYYAFDPFQLARQQGLGWVSAQTQIAYLSPARLMELVTVRTRLLAATEKSLLVEAVMFNEPKTSVKAVMWTRLVHYNLKEQKSAAHHADLLGFLRAIEHPLESGVDFDQRVAAIRSEAKLPV